MHNNYLRRLGGDKTGINPATTLSVNPVEFCFIQAVQGVGYHRINFSDTRNLLAAAKLARAKTGHPKPDPPSAKYLKPINFAMAAKQNHFFRELFREKLGSLYR